MRHADATEITRSDWQFKAVRNVYTLSWYSVTTTEWCIWDQYRLIYLVQVYKAFKTESARTSSITWTKLCTKIIYILLQTSVLLFQIYYQKKWFPANNTKHRKQISQFHWIPVNRLKDYFTK